MRIISLIFAFLFLFATNSVASSYNYIAPEQLKKDIDSDTSIMIVDIQVEDEFTKHHITGSLATYAYPVKSEEDRAKLSEALKMYQEKQAPVVIVCPRGAGGAKRTYDYFKEQGVVEDKLLILEKGMAGWPYAELTEGK